MMYIHLKHHTRNTPFNQHPPYETTLFPNKSSFFTFSCSETKETFNLACSHMEDRGTYDIFSCDICGANH